MNAKALTLQHEPLQTSEILGSSRLPAFVHTCFFMCIKVKKKKKSQSWIKRATPSTPMIRRESKAEGDK